MIKFSEKEKQFHLQTNDCSYLFKVLPSGHLAHLYFGKKIHHKDFFENFTENKEPAFGSSTSYSSENHGFSLNFEQLEYSSYGKGDYRDPSISIISDDGNRTFDFLYHSHQLYTEKSKLEGLPSSYGNVEGEVETLIVTMIDCVYHVRLLLSYSVFAEKNVYTRNVKIVNEGVNKLIIDNISSFSLDYDHSDFDLLTLDGSWIRERHRHRRKLGIGKVEISSRKGVSSSDHNPFLLLCNGDTTEFSGESYGFALMYSGNHRCSVEVNSHCNTRILMGINDFDFSWGLDQNSSFQTPEVIFSYSQKGFNGLSSIFHKFIRNNVVRGEWKYKERPVLINNWEATYFDFTEKKLLRLAKEAKNLGVELFVLDDGWFGKRDNDRSSLGDWSVNLKKLPGGIKGLAEKINKIGLDFGIWVEPEMISIDSDLYRKHPQWMVRTPLRDPSPARFQYLLDLSDPEVCDYIYNSMKNLFSSASISYVKWDMNRNFSDIYSSYLPVDKQMEFAHLYVLGLYEILEKLTSDFPHILFESCASGGNRFDLAMFYYMPQVWTSDNTDSVERLHIQYGSSLFAPSSVMGAHVSAVPNHQVLRNTPIESRFNTAAFGLLGYELDLTKLTNFEKKVIAKQVIFYKKYRQTLQFGDLYRIKSPELQEYCLWMTVSKDKRQAILGYYQILAHPNPGPERYRLQGLDDSVLYKIINRQQYLDIRQFGELINMVLPVEIKTDGLIHSNLADNYLYELENTEFSAYGDQLQNSGLSPKHQFYGTGLSNQNAFIGDFGSRIFLLEEKKE